MEKNAGLKRERVEESDGNGRFCKEAEASAAKRLRKENNVDVVCEILSKMDNDDMDFGPQEFEEEMVWDIMKMLEEEITSPTPSCTDSDDTGISSNGSDELESSGDKDCSFNSELDYLLGASDDELGIPCSPSVDTVSDHEYDSCAFFECIERDERLLLLEMWLGYCESVEQEGSDLFSVHDVNTVSNQIESGFCKG